MGVELRISASGKRTYRARIHVGNGKYENIGTFARKREAETALEEARRSLRIGQSATIKRVVFSDLVDQWLATLTVKPSTQQDYRNTAEHLRANFGVKSVNAITNQDVERFIAKFAESHSPSTTRKAATRLRQILKRAVSWGYLYESPASDIANLPKKSPKQKRALESAQVAALREAMPDYWKPLVTVAVSTGLRSSELFGLRWVDVSWDEKRVSVTGKLSRTGEREDDLKSEAARRTVDVGASALRALEAHREACPDTACGLVFPTPEGKPVHAGNFHSRVWSPARKRAGLPDVRLHDLRHTYGSLLLHTGSAIKYVQVMMGHASAQTTLDEYGHLLDRGGEGAADRLENALLCDS